MMKRFAWLVSRLARIGHAIRLALVLLAKVVFYIVYASVCAGLAFYMLAIAYHAIQVWRSGELWRTTVPDALGQVFQVPLVQPFITSWQLALLAVAAYLLSLWLCLLIAVRLFFTAGRVKEYADPGTGPILLGDTWLQPDIDPKTGALNPDPLGHHKIAHEIAQTIMRSANESPYAIAIEGRWGVGKTSVMRMVEKELQGNQKGAYFHLPTGNHQSGATEWRNFTIWFNPWRHRGRDAQKAFMSAVFSDIPSRALSWYISPLMRRRILSQVANVASFLRGSNGTSARIANKLDVNAPFRNRFQADFQAFLEYWAHAEGNAHINLVTFIDDLDRCDPADIRAILQAMKLFFDSKHCVFVLGFDLPYVVDSIQSDSHGVIADGMVYLQKLIQAEYRLPQPTDDSLKRLLRQYRKAARLDTQLAVIANALRKNRADPQDYRKLILEYTRRTPRQMKRLINGLVISLPLHEPSEYVSVFFSLLMAIVDPQAHEGFRRSSARHSTREALESMGRGANVRWRVM